ncbi:hypothetical protein [Cyanobium sp. HWJ4-Hawea]|uniref:hypothetical protein n=1 Tax=Cyanobium sp. HWJ4-Hawea TaxID=2823713 RepID=UPI0020CF6EE3|nr:hypothetical protein [Cyanobium sp. HWJ4-Hawea]
MLLIALWLAALSPYPQPWQATGREAEPVAVCVVAPRVEPVQQGDALGVVPTPRPQLLVTEPLLELRLERNGRLAWQKFGTLSQPLTGPIAWPIAPLAPGEVVLVRLRPLQAAAGSFAHVQLIGASAQRMASTHALMRSLAQRPAAWLKAVDTALDRGDVPLAWTLLFAPAAPQSPGLQDLRDQVLRQGCGD